MIALVLYVLVAVLVSLVAVRLDPSLAKRNEWGDSPVYPMALLWPLTLVVFAVAGVCKAWSSLIAWYAPATEAPDAE